MRSVLPFNQGWLFAPRELSYDAADSAFVRVSLPHTNIELPHHNFDNLEYQFISTYRQRFTLPEPLNGRRLFVDFDGAMTASTVSINGRVLGDHDGGYTPFSFDLTDHLRDGENVLQVRLDSTERPDIPPNGYVVDYLTFGGIYREAWLRFVEPLYFSDSFLRQRDILSDSPHAELDVWVKNLTPTDQTAIVYASIAGDSGTVGDSSQTVTFPAGETTKVTLTMALADFKLWSLNDPVLYRCNICLDQPDGGEPFDVTARRVGFREAVFKPEGFFLNGEKVKIVGLNRHQNYAYIGGAAPARLQRKDAEILKHELGVNLARTSHYPQSPHFLDRCDEIGLLVFEEIPGWQHIGDSDWKALSLKNVEDMIVRDRHHPSIILWGVRINESMDDEGLYRATNDLAHKLDPTRQTGGVRFFQGSQFLEDVFTYNDFSNTLIEPNHAPYLVTEFNGHMYPTKSYDSEAQQVEHALRHARIQDKNFEMDNITGAIGWCAFDYNTHREFGAGDRICYHGVSDIFRLPKFAAYVYESQIDPSVRPVVRVASVWTFGENAGGGTEPLYVFSNCDEIEVFKGQFSHARLKPDREAFPHLPHPPFKVMGLALMEVFGSNYQDLRVVGYVNGQAVAEQRLSAKGVPHALTLAADDGSLNADGADMTRLVFRIVDEFGNRLPYCTTAVAFDVQGAGKLVGENPFSLVGGQAAVYVRAGETAGEITVTARAARLNEAVVKIRVG
jgi:beta-galactosidase